MRLALSAGTDCPVACSKTTIAANIIAYNIDDDNGNSVEDRLDPAPFTVDEDELEPANISVNWQGADLDMNLRDAVIEFMIGPPHGIRALAVRNYKAVVVTATVVGERQKVRTAACWHEFILMPKAPVACSLRGANSSECEITGAMSRQKSLVLTRQSQTTLVLDFVEPYLGEWSFSIHVFTDEQQWLRFHVA